MSLKDELQKKLDEKASSAVPGKEHGTPPIAPSDPTDEQLQSLDEAMGEVLEKLDALGEKPFDEKQFPETDFKIKQQGKNFLVKFEHLGETYSVSGPEKETALQMAKLYKLKLDMVQLAGNNTMDPAQKEQLMIAANYHFNKERKELSQKALTQGKVYNIGRHYAESAQPHETAKSNFEDVFGSSTRSGSSGDKELPDDAPGEMPESTEPDLFVEAVNIGYIATLPVHVQRVKLGRAQYKEYKALKELASQHAKDSPEYTAFMHQAEKKRSEANSNLRLGAMGVVSSSSVAISGVMAMLTRSSSESSGGPLSTSALAVYLSALGPALALVLGGITLNQVRKEKIKLENLYENALAASHYFDVREKNALALIHPDDNLSRDEMMKSGLLGLSIETELAQTICRHFIQKTEHDLTLLNSKKVATASYQGVMGLSFLGSDLIGGFLVAAGAGGAVATAGSIILPAAVFATGAAISRYIKNREHKRNAETLNELRRDYAESSPEAMGLSQEEHMYFGLYLMVKAELREAQLIKELLAENPDQPIASTSPVFSMYICQNLLGISGEEFVALVEHQVKFEVNLENPDLQKQWSGLNDVLNEYQKERTTEVKIKGIDTEKEGVKPLTTTSIGAARLSNARTEHPEQLESPKTYQTRRDLYERRLEHLGETRTLFNKQMEQMIEKGSSTLADTIESCDKKIKDYESYRGQTLDKCQIVLNTALPGNQIKFDESKPDFGLYRIISENRKTLKQHPEVLAQLTDAMALMNDCNNGIASAKVAIQECHIRTEKIIKTCKGNLEKLDDKAQGLISEHDALSQKIESLNQDYENKINELRDMKENPENSNPKTQKKLDERIQKLEERRDRFYDKAISRVDAWYGPDKVLFGKELELQKKFTELQGKFSKLESQILQTSRKTTHQLR